MAPLVAVNAWPMVFIAATNCSAVKTGYGFLSSAAAARRPAIPVTAIRIAPPAERRTRVRQPGLHIASERRQTAVAVAELLHRHSHLLEDGRVQVGERRALRMTDVAAALEAGGLAADQRDRQVVVEVRVAVADPGAVEEQRVVQHHPVAFRDGRELLHEIPELAEVILVDLVQ